MALALVGIASLTAGTAAAQTPQLTLNLVAQGLNQPTAIAFPDDGTGRMFVVERAGTIRIHDGVSLLPTPFLDISSLVLDDFSERGLLGLAFHPDFANNDYFFVYYSADASGPPLSDGDSVVARYSVSAGNPNVADPASALIVLTVDQPDWNHNGGQIELGPDGFLYVALGDGGGGGDPGDNGQDPTTLLGSILRVDVDGDDFPADAWSNYSIPPDNPFVGNAGGLDEIWVWGLRNPWRFSFDRFTGDLFIGDVGQGTYEEVSFQPFNSSGGENFGWDCFEGNHIYSSSAPSCTTDPNDYVPPILEYSHSQFTSFACSVTGGYRYRGTRHARLQGLYLFADYCAGYIFAGSETSPGSWSFEVLFPQAGDTSFNVTTFGEDRQGELYVAAYDLGHVYRIGEASGGVSADGFECGDTGAWGH
jgi:glucose/arabinose dehydrogenase